jgi:hypothetical protein
MVRINIDRLHPPGMTKRKIAEGVGESAVPCRRRPFQRRTDVQTRGGAWLTSTSKLRWLALLD